MTQTPDRRIILPLAVAGRPNLLDRPDLARRFVRDLIGNVPGWDGTAACATADPEAFFPRKGENPAYAKNICRRCDIQEKCLDGAVNRGEKYGIWGGQAKKTLDKLRAERRKRRP